jgi:hypothetical protein
MFFYFFASFALCKKLIILLFILWLLCTYKRLKALMSVNLTDMVPVCKNKAKKRIFDSIFIKNDELDWSFCCEVRV